MAPVSDCTVQPYWLCVYVLLQNGATPQDLAQKAGHMMIVRLMSGPDTYQQNLDAGFGGQVSAVLHSHH